MSTPCITRTCKLALFCTLSVYRMLLSIICLVRIGTPLHCSTKRGPFCSLYKPATDGTVLTVGKQAEFLSLLVFVGKLITSQPFIL